MERTFRTLVFCLLPLLPLACNKPAPPQADPKQDKVHVEIKPQTELQPVLPIEFDAAADFTFTPADPATEKYEVALGQALNFQAEQKWIQALDAYQTAQTFKDSEFVRSEIERLKLRVDQEASANKTVQEIESILEDGKPAEAAKLAQAALKEFGDGNIADQIVKLNLQADALANADATESVEDRFVRMRNTGAAALADNNLRAAGIAFEQALQIKANDLDVRSKYDQIQGQLSKYDALRKRGAELRRDPLNLEEAIAVLEDAKATWDTLQIRQELDEASVALSQRRDTLSVVDFETPANSGLGDVGGALAEELLPSFKQRFNLVERKQLQKVLAQLSAEADFQNDPAQQRDVGKIARVRYLVVGSVHRLGDIIINARLVDTQSGLIVQTARISGRSLPHLLPRLPELAQQLMMSDEEKLALLNQQAKAQVQVEPLLETATFAPAPVVDAPVVPLAEFPLAPTFGAFDVKQFDPLPAAAPAGGLIVVAQGPPPSIRKRLELAAVNAGDYFFRLRNYGAARHYYQFALTLAPWDLDVRGRVALVQPLLPPNFALFSSSRQRVAILDFHAQPPVNPGIGSWTAQGLAPYFSSHYDLADPREVYWFMGSVGLTMNDLVVNADARRWLGRALNIQYFVMGNVHAGSFHVHSFMLHAEHGYIHSRGHVYARSTWELKVRLHELAQETMFPEQRKIVEVHRPQFTILLEKGRQHMNQKQFSLAITFFEDALRLNPGHVEVIGYRNQAAGYVSKQKLEEQRRLAFAQQHAEQEEARRRQLKLAQLAEQQRFQAAQAAAHFAEKERQQQEAQRLAAQNQLMKQAQFALQGKNFSVAVNLFDSALRLAPPKSPRQGELLQQLAQAKAEAAAAEKRALDAQFQAQREKDLAEKRNRELVRTRERLFEEQKKADEAKKLTFETKKRDFAIAKQQGDGFLKEQKYDAAIAAYSAAQKIMPNQNLNDEMNQAMLARAQQTAKDQASKDRLRAKLEEETQKRIQAEALAKQNQELYQAALQLAQKALSEKQYEVAQAKFSEAGKIFQTDAVLTGLNKVNVERQNHAKAEARKERLNQLLSDGKTAVAANDARAALKALGEAKKLAPQNVEVLALHSQAEQLQVRLDLEARKAANAAEQTKAYDRFLSSGREQMKNKQYAAAALALNEALKAKPGDPAVLALLKQAQDLNTQAGDDSAAKKKFAEYQKSLADARFAQQSKQYDVALKHLADAQKLMPGDPATKALLADVQNSKFQEDQAALKKLESGKQAKAIADALDLGRTALAQKNLELAKQHLDRAAKINPTHPDVVKALAAYDVQDRAAKEGLALQQKRKQFDDLLDNGEKALKNGKYLDAIQIANQANQLMPGSKQGAELLTRAQKAQSDSGAAAKLDADFQKAMKSGVDAFKTMQFTEAEKHFQNALSLRPADPQAQGYLKQAGDAKLAAGQSQLAFDKAVAAGQNALKAKQFDEAEKHFRSATTLRPGDPQVAGLLKSVDEARQSAAALSMAQKAASLALQKELVAGQAALKDKNFDVAEKHFKNALTLQPGDPQIQGLLKAASDGKQAAGQNQLAFQKLMQAGQTALQGKQFADAEKQFLEALKLNPSDPQAQGMLKLAVDGKQAAGAANEQYQKVMNAGQLALQAKNYALAEKHFQDALTLRPLDPLASNMLGQSRQARANDQAKVAAHQEALAKGKVAVVTKNYAEAVKQFSAAKMLMPADPETNRLLTQTVQEWEKAKQTPIPNPMVKPEPIKPMVKPQPDPVKPMVKPQPDPAKPMPPGKGVIAQYKLHLFEGNKQLMAKNFPAAIASFEAALRLVPDDPAAKALLDQAKKGKK